MTHRVVFLDEIVDIRSGCTPSRIEPKNWVGTFPWASAKDLKSFELHGTIESISCNAATQLASVAPSGAVLVLTRGMTLLKDVPVAIATRNVAFNQDLKALLPRAGVHGRYLAHWLVASRSRLRRMVGVAGHGTGKLDTADLLALPIRLPPHPVQSVIAGVFDAAVRLELRIGELTLKKRRLKQALLQQLLTGKLRFPEFRRTRLRRVALRDVAHELAERNGERFGVEHVMGVLKHEGLVPMRERSIASDISRYKRVPPNAFAYNPMRLNIGSIAFSWHPHDVLVSPDYEVFQCDRAKLEPRYLDHVRRGAAWGSFVRRAGSGSVRVRIYFNDLAQFVFLLPSLGEQRRIAALLDGIDTELNLLDRQLAAVRKLKRGLMQKLLTGELEVPAADEPKGDEVHA